MVYYGLDKIKLVFYVQYKIVMHTLLSYLLCDLVLGSNAACLALALRTAGLEPIPSIVIYLCVCLHYAEWSVRQRQCYHNSAVLFSKPWLWCLDHPQLTQLWTMYNSGWTIAHLVFFITFISLLFRRCCIKDGKPKFQPVGKKCFLSENFHPEIRNYHLDWYWFCS